MDSKPERFGRALAALLGSAVLFYFGTGVAPVAALAWLAPIPVLLLAPRVSAWTAMGVAFLASFLGATNSWGLYLVSVDVPFPMGLLITFGFGLVFALAVGLFRALLLQGRALLATVTAPAVWVATFYLVSVLNPSGIQGTMVTTQADVPTVIQLAALAGGWSVEYLVLLVPFAVGAVLAPGVATAARLRTGIATAVVLAAVLGFGVVRLSNASTDDQVQRVALFARNEDKWGADPATPAGQDVVKAYADQISAMPAGVRIAVLPEGRFEVTDASMSALVQPMTAVARARGAHIVIGVMHRTEAGKFNLALDIPPAGGEPVAYRRWNTAASPNKPGHDLAWLPGLTAPAGAQVCGDVNFPNPSRDYASAGARLMLLPASDNLSDGWQHSRTALLRGVENGFSVAWSAARGTSMASDGWGRVVGETVTGGPERFSTVVTDLPAGPGATLYTRLGDWFAWLCLALALGGLAVAVGTTRQLRQRAASTAG